MIGQAVSTSLNALMIRFVGGPYDGQSGLFDSGLADGITFCNLQTDEAHEYAPVSGRWNSKGSDTYVFKATYKMNDPTANEKPGAV